ncbi:carbon-nitrogen hydrolase [Daldinia caldariorum]|uniref:carbon-nitrogen hydrolase n=1 Tax=Daldinia caldariorum TaxID=326644 RepID=UPI002007C5DC|nr:carbon-nitrogen hydrolase [Daldinia caldariorum]KAI1471473.1 carbon-nitrogen hydrolase [Daldinia caldariorum]
MAKAAIGQICSSNSMAHNLEQCVKLVGQAAAAGAKILFLPEASDYIGTSAQESLFLAQPIHTSPFVSGLRSAAAQHRLAVHVGIHVPVTVKPVSSSSTPTAAATISNPVLPTTPSEDQDQDPSSASPGTSITKLYNRSIYIRDDGSLHPDASYDKLHLFDYPDAALRESASTQAGSRFAPPFDSPVGRLGSLICFDLRFPEPALHLTVGVSSPSPSSSSFPSPSSPTSSKKPFPPAQVLLYPSAFTVPTGRAHWEVLLRARAVETQSWVVAAAQVGLHNPGSSSSSRVSYGRSMVVDPWGRVVLALKGVREKEPDGGYEVEDGAVGELGIVDVDLGLWEKVRRQMPLVRRTDIYPEI